MTSIYAPPPPRDYISNPQKTEEAVLFFLMLSYSLEGEDT
jgi:hypothetical protein